MSDEPLIEFQVTERVLIVLIICATLLFGTCLVTKELPHEECRCKSSQHGGMAVTPGSSPGAP